MNKCALQTYSSGFSNSHSVHPNIPLTSEQSGLHYKNILRRPPAPCPSVDRGYQINRSFVRVSGHGRSSSALAHGQRPNAHHIGRVLSVGILDERDNRRVGHHACLQQQLRFTPPHALCFQRKARRGVEIVRLGYIHIVNCIFNDVQAASRPELFHQGAYRRQLGPNEHNLLALLPANPTMPVAVTSPQQQSQQLVNQLWHIRLSIRFSRGRDYIWGAALRSEELRSK